MKVLVLEAARAVRRGRWLDDLNLCALARRQLQRHGAERHTRNQRRVVRVADADSKQHGSVEQPAPYMECEHQGGQAAALLRLCRRPPSPTSPL